ncbi:MAG: phosphoribosylamine--glycine ligase [bacterium]
MHVLIIGSGGREHALAWGIARSEKTPRISCSPGNAGTAKLGKNVELDIDCECDVPEFCAKEKVDLVIIGPEDPLVGGLADVLRESGIRVFGPSSSAAQLEGSKIFGKEFCLRHGIPTASFKVFDEPYKAHVYIDKYIDDTAVVKADGLAAGKGAMVCDDPIDAHAAVDTCMVDHKFGSAGDRILIEERLTGFETTLLTLVSGQDYRKFPYSQDHKRAFDGNKGPNTGGMGVFAPTPKVTGELDELITKKIVEPTVKGLAKDGIDYIGCLYFGLMITESGPSVIEFNVRFGDPEIQAVLPLIESDFLAALEACVDGKPNKIQTVHSNKKAVSVILASNGYPGKYDKGVDITANVEVLESNEKILVFHAGTKRDRKKILTSGGRVLAVTALADDFEDCRKIAYEAIGELDWTGLFYRKDIARELVPIK